MSTEIIDKAAKIVRLTKKNYTAAIILAAGTSSRMGKGINKQLYQLRGVPVLARTLLAYERCPLIREIVVVGAKQNLDEIAEICQLFNISKMTKIVEGGNTRQESAICGMRALSEKAAYVAIADGARCLTTPVQIARVCAAAYRHQAASAAHKVTDTIKRTTPMGMSQATVDRTNLWQAQTPQVFNVSLYLAAIHRSVRDRFIATDDNALIEHLGYRVYMVECGVENLKITTPLDLPLAEAIVAYREASQK